MVTGTSLRLQALPKASTSWSTALGSSSLRAASWPLVADNSSHAGCDVRPKRSGAPATTCTLLYHNAALCPCERMQPVPVETFLSIVTPVDATSTTHNMCQAQAHKL